MEETRRFRIPFKPVLLLLVVGAVAANVPRGWFTEETQEVRRGAVFSEFVNLSAEPGAGEMAFLQSWAALSGQSRRARKDRIGHVQPALLDAYAAHLGISAEAMRKQFLSPEVATPFDLRTVPVERPDFAVHGQAGDWFWGLIDIDRSMQAEADRPFAWCSVWVVYWTPEDWFYAPVGTELLDGFLLQATPALAELSPQALPRCDGGESSDG